MDIPFYQVNSFIVNSYKLQYTDLFKICPNISLENYIKSQLHCNIVTPIYNRNLQIYKEAYEYLKDNKYFKSSFQQVIKWYYTDLGNSLLKSFTHVDKDFSLLDLSIANFSSHLGKVISISKVEDDLRRILDNNEQVEDGEFNYIRVLLDLNLHNVDDLKPTRILAELLAMKFVASQRENYVIGVK